MITSGSTFFSPSLRIKNWRQALRQGFENGFKSRFAVTLKDQPCELLLELEATPGLDYKQHGIPAVIRFHARLRHRDGRVLAQISESVSPPSKHYQAHIVLLDPQRAANQESVKKWYQSGIERLYEYLGWRFFGKEQERRSLVKVCGILHKPQTPLVTCRGPGSHPLEPLSKLPRLRDLTLQSLSAVDFTPVLALRGLKKLGIADTPIKTLPSLAPLKALRVLELFATKVTSLTPLAGLKGLQKLTLRESPMRDLRPLAGLSGLRELYLLDLSVTDLTPLGKLRGLTSLWVRTPFLHVKPLAALTRLRTLHLQSKKLRDLTPLRSLTNLKELHVHNNQVRDLTPLSSLSNLRHLDISDTQVRDLKPLTKLKSLQRLHISNTPVTDITPLLKLELLSVLYIGGCKIPAAQLSLLQKKKPSLNIVNR